MVCSTKEKNKCYNSNWTLKVFPKIVILPNLEMELTERVREYGNIAEDLLGKSRREDSENRKKWWRRPSILHQTPKLCRWSSWKGLVCCLNVHIPLTYEIPQKENRN
jgi:hypothetical protein